MKFNGIEFTKEENEAHMRAVEYSRWLVDWANEKMMSPTELFFLAMQYSAANSKMSGFSRENFLRLAGHVYDNVHPLVAVKP